MAIVVEFKNEISPSVNSLVGKLNLLKIKGVVETIPTYRSLTLCYNPEIISYSKIFKIVNKACQNLTTIENTPAVNKAKIHLIPTCYSEKFGEDIAFVAKHANLSIPEVIELHSKTDYLIYMLGFLPGFAYLGGLNEKIITPRLQSPRTIIPAGSVGIGGSQTGIYPLNSPGGWQLIGRTPLKPYDIDRKNPILYNASEYIRFCPISEEEYFDIEQKISNNTYKYMCLTEVPRL